jgi:hypothetical protein
MAKTGMKDWPKSRARKREGRCYELAANELLELPSNTPWRLVHGCVNGPGGSRIGHAWLELKGPI